MNPSNPFGNPQGGAFQAPNNTSKTGLFQSFGQQSSSIQPQTTGFYQPSAFGQSPQMNITLGQTPSFGQPSTQPPSLPTVSQTPAFRQTPLGMSSSGFANSATLSFGQTSGQSQSTVFTQIPTFGQPSVFGQAPEFGKKSSGFVQQPSGFGNAQRASSSTTPLRQPPSLGFGQSVFGQLTSTGVTNSVFGTAHSGTQSKGFGLSNFSFKPANEALFKPIFSASPEPANLQTTSMSNSPFGSSGSQTNTSTVSSSSTTTTGFSLLTAAKSGPLGFSFAQPAAAPSISPQNNLLTTGNSSSPSTTLQFTFSQPAVPSNSSTQVSTCQPTTPSSFSFAVEAPTHKATPLFGGITFGQPSLFGETKAKAETNADEKGISSEGTGDTNVFSRLSKGTKRKEDTAVSITSLDKPATKEDVPAETDSTRSPIKRPLMMSCRPAVGLFGRALSDLRKDKTNSGRQAATKEMQQQASPWVETEREEVKAQSEDLPATPLTSQAWTGEALEKPEESDLAKAPDPKLETTTPVKDGVHSESSESLASMSPTDCTTLQCRNVPPALNKKDVIEKHFSRFGKVWKVFCRPGKNLALVYFHDHASAAKAKKKGKILHRRELLLLWQRKKQSTGDSRSRPAAGREETDGESASSTLRRHPLGAPAASSMVAFSHSSPMKKSPLAKSLQSDTEPQKESSTEVPSLETPIPSSLLHLIGQVAETSEDKYRLLEQKDKILRQGRSKRTGLDMSKVFVGTCPDMCPEKERFMRETRKQLSIFEIIPNTEMVDHPAAIKEYSRSSADQEEPLPHELRPLPVLSMTMDYLVTQIMDQSHDKYRDWYDFVWNRTRSIRKDITQQHLCCPQTVSLIEKCTRFHVHCAHHLCQEHISSFDAKINTENMTKCLQSLKEMYQDLATRHIYCSHEAEFRQYSVLLKLNDGDILREVQQFRDVVRNSPEVKFALQAFAAVDNNNYVRFFKLVKRASYLASCLLHSYFNQVRAKALKTLNVAYTVGPRSTAFPVEDIVQMLMFRNTAEASDFIQQYGLIVNDDVVELNRITYQEPDRPLPQIKSDVILAKKSMLIGEVVHGGSLPNPPQHIPVCSFDSQNKYCGEGPLVESSSNQFKDINAKEELKAPPSVELVTQVVLTKVPDVDTVVGSPPNEIGEPSWAQPADTQQLFQQISRPQPVKPPSKPQPVYTNEDIVAVLDCVVEEVIEAGVREVAHSGARYASAALVESSVQAESLLSEVLGQMLQEVSSTEIKLEQECVAEEKRKLEEARRREEHKALMLQLSLSLCTEIVHEVLDETIKETATYEIQQAVNEKAEHLAQCTEQVCTSLVEETLNEDVAWLVEDILEAELHRIHKYINRWRDVVAVRRQLKRQMRGFPAAPCCVDPRFKLKALTPSAPAQPSLADLTLGVVNLGNAGTLAASSTRVLKVREEVIHQMRVHHYYQQLLDEKVWAPLNLPALVTKHISNPPDRIFWKAVLLLPSDHNSVTSLADRILSDWLEVKLGGGKGLESGEEQLEDSLRTLCVINTLQEKEEHIHKVHVSVKASRGPVSEDGLSKMEECCELHGIGALITLLPALPIMMRGHSEQDVPLLSALLQLKQLQKASSWHCPLPLAILVPGPDNFDTQELAEALMLHALVKEGLISEFTFLFIPETTSDLQGTKQLNEAMRWLLARAPPHIPLSCQTLMQLIETSLSHEFSPRVYSHRRERAAADLPPEAPVPVIQLYNTVVAHIADKVSSQELSRLSWPPAEFCQPDTRNFVPPLRWNSVQHLNWIRKAILSLQLPQWEKQSATDSWSELCTSIFHYASQIPVSRLSQPLLMSRLENLLERVRLKGRCSQISASKLTASNWSDGDKNMCPTYSQIPWDDIVVICIDHKLKDWRVPGPPVCEDVVTVDGEILVYFPIESLSGFQPPEEWTQAIRKTHREKQQEMERMTAAACATPTNLSLRQKLFNSVVEPPEPPPALLDITHTPTAHELLAHNVLHSLEKQKAESKRFTEQLQRWLDGDPVEHLSTPLLIPSSILHSMPTIITNAPTARTRNAALTQQEWEPDGLSDKADWPKTRPASTAQRLKELEKQILASQEEELACRLTLSALLSIVED